MNQPLATELAYLDRSHWKQWQEIDAGGNSGFFRTIVEAFLQSTTQTLESLRIASGSSGEKLDPLKARTYAHSLRSSCEVIGALNLANHFLKLELDLKQDSIFPTAQDLTTVEVAIEKISLVLADLLLHDGF